MIDNGGPRGIDRVEDARLLVVDDDPSNVQLLQAMLRHLGFHDVHALDDPRAAVPTVRGLEPELVLTDWHMPHVSGEDLLCELKADVRSSGIPVVVLTGDPGARRRALELGATDFLPKPVDRVEVYYRLRNALRLQRLHDQLRRQNQELEERVRVRTAELEEANADLERMAEIRRDFVAMASHEMRTPLTVVLGFIAHWSRSGAAAIEDRHLEAAHRNARRLQHLVNNLLIASGVEGSSRGSRQETCELAGILHAGVESAGPESVVTVACPARATVDGDPELLRQVVANLVSNADRYGRPPIIVSAEVSADAVLVQVVDHGPGVPDGFAPHLFRRFSQASTGDRRTSVGAGLGLWLSRRIVELHGGRLSYERASHAGAVFTFSLPRAVPPAGA